MNRNAVFGLLFAGYAALDGFTVVNTMYQLRQDLPQERRFEMTETRSRAVGDCAIELLVAAYLIGKKKD